MTSDVPVPHEVFRVAKSSPPLRYRFRAVCASMSFAFRLRIDGHMLHVVSVDGADVKECIVESAIVFPGERLDFWIQADDPLRTGKYWIRAENLEYRHYGKVREYGHYGKVREYGHFGKVR